MQFKKSHIPGCNCFDCVEHPDSFFTIPLTQHADDPTLRAKVPVTLYKKPDVNGGIYRVIPAGGVIGEIISPGWFESTPDGWLDTTFGWIKDDPSTYYQGTVSTDLNTDQKLAVITGLASGSSPLGAGGVAASTIQTTADTASFVSGNWRLIVGAVIVILILILAIKLN